MSSSKELCWCSVNHAAEQFNQTSPVFIFTHESAKQKSYNLNVGFSF